MKTFWGVMIVCIFATTAMAQQPHICNGIILELGTPKIQAQPLKTVTVGPVIQSGTVHPCPFLPLPPPLPPPVWAPIYGHPSYSLPIYMEPPRYWKPGCWYRSELTGYQWRWREGHWCTNPY